MLWLCYSRPSASARTWGRDLAFVATGGPAGGAGWERTLPTSVPYSSSLPLLKPSVILIASLHNAVISSSDGSVYLCLSIYISTLRRAIAFLSHPMPHITAIAASAINNPYHLFVLPYSRKRFNTIVAIPRPTLRHPRTNDTICSAVTVLTSRVSLGCLYSSIGILRCQVLFIGHL